MMFIWVFKMNGNSENIKESLRSIKHSLEAEDVNLNLFFTKKERIKGETNFKFFRAHHNGNATEALKEILIGNIEKVKNENYINDFNENNSDAFVKIDLSLIDNWQHYEGALNNIESHEIENLKALKKSLNNFMISHKDENGVIVGQIRRIYPKQVLLNKGFISLPFNENVFNEVKEDHEHVEIDNDFDVLLIVKDDEKIAIARDQTIFNEIFDMDDQIKREALEVVSESRLYDFFEDKDRILRIAKEDRNIQSMLRNKITMEGFSEISLNDLELAKTKLGSIVDFNITDGRIVLSENNEKESLKGVIKAAGYHFNESLYGEHIIEGRPTKKLN